MRVLSKLDSNDKRCEDNELGVDRIDVQLLSLRNNRSRRESVSLRRGGKVVGEERARETPSTGETRVEAVENAHRKSDRLDRQVCAAEDGLHQRHRGGGQGGRRGDEVDKVDGGACE